MRSLSQSMDRRARSAAARAACLFDLGVLLFRLPPPPPGVLEGFGLRAFVAALALVRFKDDVVVLAALEGRIEIHQIDGSIGHVLPQDVEVVAVEKRIHVPRVIVANRIRSGEFLA
jgi:hypothetical protein